MTRAGLVRFAEVPNEYDFVLIPEHNLLLCHIAKNAGTAFQKLVHELRLPSDPALKKWSFYQGSLATTYFGKTPSDIAAMLANSSFHKAVFLRDPLERFYSAWASKCANRDADGRRVCYQVFGSASVGFGFAAMSLGARKKANVDLHFKHQYRMCGGLPGTLPWYQTVERINASRMHETVDSLLRAVGVRAEVADRLAGKHFGVRRRIAHAHESFADEAAPAMYAKINSSALVTRLAVYYLRDYVSLDLPVPVWARPMIDTSTLGSAVSKLVGGDAESSARTLRALMRPRD